MGKRKSVRKPLLEAEENELNPSLYEDEEEDDDGEKIDTSYYSNSSSAESPIAAKKDEEKTCLVSKSSPDLQAQYCCRVSGPGLQTATANCPTCVLIELKDLVTGQPCTHSQAQALVADFRSHHTSHEDKHHHQQPHHHVPFWKRHKHAGVTVEQKTTANYCVHFTPTVRGEHRLHIAIDGIEVKGSPCHIIVYPDPTQLRKPIGEIPNCSSIWGAAVNSQGEIIASNFSSNEVMIIHTEEGEVVSSFDCHSPSGITVDSDDNIYVSCVNQIKKFSRNGRLLTMVGKSGDKEGEFRSVEGLAHCKGLIYACDTLNNRIQVFDTDLNQVKTIGCEGSGNIEFSQPWDIDFDAAGRAYIVDKNNDRVQVIDVKRGGFLKEIRCGGGGKGRLSHPTGVHVAGEFVYVSDDQRRRVAVFKTVTGEFVTSFGAHTDPSGRKYCGPFRICSEKGGNCRIYVFDLVSAHIY